VILEILQLFLKFICFFSSILLFHRMLVYLQLIM